MLEFLSLLAALLRAQLRSRADLVAENLLLRHQLAALTRTARKRPRTRTRDRLFWVLVRMVHRDWRRHLVSCSRRRSSGGIARDGDCSGGGSPARGWAVRA